MRFLGMVEDLVPSWMWHRIFTSFQSRIIMTMPIMETKRMMLDVVEVMIIINFRFESRCTTNFQGKTISTTCTHKYYGHSRQLNIMITFSQYELSINMCPIHYTPYDEFEKKIINLHIIPILLYIFSSLNIKKFVIQCVQLKESMPAKHEVEILKLGCCWGEVKLKRHILDKISFLMSLHIGFPPRL